MAKKQTANQAAGSGTSRAEARCLRASNELNTNVTIEAVDGSRFLLAPLEEGREVSPTDDRRFALRCWPEVVDLDDAPAQQADWTVVLAAYGIGFFFVIPWAILAAIVGAPQWWLIGWAALGALILGCFVIDLLRNHWTRGDQSLPRRTARWLRSEGGQQLYLLLVVLIGFVLPAAAIFFASDAWSLIGQLHDGKSGPDDPHLVRLTLIGRLMQLIFVGIASLTPALLFFVFDREHLRTLRRRFMRQILRFDPSVSTRRQVLAKYSEAMDEAYGLDVRGKILPGRRSPLLLATSLIALGWTYTLLHGDVQLISERGIASLFEPRVSAVSFAFLGAYFYGLNVVLRGYVRKDLRAKTYSTLAVRIVVVVVLAWVLELVWSGTTLYVLAFLTGIFPETALVLIKQVARGGLQGIAGPLSLGGEETDPLTKLEGVDLYDLARLFDEGVTNVQGLANDDIVELMLQTRIPAPRILDWVDQAILYLHAGSTRAGDGAAVDQPVDAADPQEAAGKEDGAEEAPAAPVATGPVVSDRVATLSALRRYGIRTATDLFNAYDAAKETGRDDEFLRVLPDAAEGATPRIQALVDVLRDEEWVLNLQHWRKRESSTPEECLKLVSDLHPETVAAAYPPPGSDDPPEAVDDTPAPVDGRHPLGDSSPPAATETATRS
jgi:hypothetical protein